jgi:hypothetical protein
VLGVAWTVAAAVVVLIPALRPGISLGPFDLLTRFGLTRQPGVTVHNSVQADQIEQFVPWINLAWHQVHSGHLPLWDPDNVLGMPLAFNWQSGAFSVPALVGYLFPVTYAYAAIVLTKLVVAGAGAYALCRVLGLGPLAAAFGGTAFELSGPMIVHAGWPHTAVTCWAGWILLGAVGLLRGRRRLGSGALLAVAVGAAVYGGHPESLIVTGLSVVVFVAVYLLARARSGGGALARPVADMAVSALCGFGLGAPLLFPGVQLALSSSRRYGTAAAAFPLSHVPNLLASGLQGGDFKTAAYVGVVVLALAVVGVRVGWKNPYVPAAAAVVVVTGLLTFVAPVDSVLHLVPGGRTVAWSRSVMLLALGLAVLAAAGIDALARPARDLTALRWAAGAFAALGAVVVLLVVAGQVGLAPALAHRQGSLVWPAAQAVGGLALTGAWWWWLRRPTVHGSASRDATAWRAVPALLLALETGFLLSVGIPSWSVSASYFPTTPAITAMQHTVGTALVGFGRCAALRYNTASGKEVGIRPDANIGYGLHEMVVYDPIVPDSYYHAWFAVTGQHALPSLAALGVYCPRITTVAEARLFGVQYVLEPPGHLGPPGSVSTPVAPGGEDLYAVPGSAPATASPIPADGAALATEAPGTPLAVTYPGPASWRVVTDQPTDSIVRLRLTDVPGWQATVDGRPLHLEPWATGSMLEARVPAGRHVVELHYWPAAFSAGLVVGAVSAGALVLATAGGSWRSVRRRRASTPR